MRKIIWTISVSVDGYMEGPNREIDWHMVDDELHRHMNGWLAGAGGFLEGRVTYELMAEFYRAPERADRNATVVPTWCRPRSSPSRHSLVETSSSAAPTWPRVRPSRPDRRVPPLRPPDGDRAWHADAPAVGREGPVGADRDAHFRQRGRHVAVRAASSGARRRVILVGPLVAQA